jgi:hypothetical protein
MAMVKAKQGARQDALSAFRNGRDIISRLAGQLPNNAALPNDLNWFDHQIVAQEK